MTLKIEIYTRSNCPYCLNAKSLFDQKGVSYQEIRIDQSQEQTEAMLKRSHGLRSVPQIFINDQLIGGFDQLLELERNHHLDKLLSEKDTD